MGADIAGWSSPVARRAHNPKVVGSNPAPATISVDRFRMESVNFFLLKTTKSRRFSYGFLLYR